MAIELVPLCTLQIQFKPIEVGTGPAGTRLIGDFTSAHLQGDRLRGEMVGSATADWLLIGPEGTGSVDVRATFRIDDGATIFVQYHGWLDASDSGDRQGDSPRRLFARLRVVRSSLGPLDRWTACATVLLCSSKHLH